MPQISVVIPARNEEAYIGNCFEALAIAEQRLGQAVEKIVVINRCTDDTAQIAQRHGAQLVYDDSKNLSKIRNSGCRAATGEIVVTVDADSRMSPELLCEVDCQLSKGDVIGGGVLILPERWSLGIICTALVLLPIALWYGISGGVFWFRRSDFEAIGGFNEQLCSVEDIDFAKRLKAHGRSDSRRFVNLYRHHIITSCRKFDRFGDWFAIKNPRKFLQLMRGRNQALADEVWYDY